MELVSPSQIKKLLQRQNLWAKKSLGQHFLIDQNVLDKIIKAADLSQQDVVLEIGPGLGVLTRQLAKKAKRVVAVEIDKKMVEILKENLKGIKNIEIIEGDILKTKNLKLKSKNYKLIANIPYQITSPLLDKFLLPDTEKLIPDLIVLMVQKEVAEKICSKPPKMSRLSVFVQTFGKCEILSKVSKNCFWPKPEVDSALIRIKPYKTQKIKDVRLYLDLVRRAFIKKRKQLKNTLNQKILEKAKINKKRRPQELSLKEWEKIYEAHQNYFRLGCA